MGYGVVLSAEDFVFNASLFFLAFFLCLNPFPLPHPQLMQIPRAIRSKLPTSKFLLMSLSLP